MASRVTENDYPVESSWLLKGPIGTLILVLFITLIFIFILFPLFFTTSDGTLIMFILIFGTSFLVFFISLVNSIISILARNNFHYSLENEFMIFHQGVISKEQKIFLILLFRI